MQWSIISILKTFIKVINRHDYSCSIKSIAIFPRFKAEKFVRFQITKQTDRFLSTTAGPERAFFPVNLSWQTSQLQYTGI